MAGTLQRAATSVDERGAELVFAQPVTVVRLTHAELTALVDGIELQRLTCDFSHPATVPVAAHGSAS